MPIRNYGNSWKWAQSIYSDGMWGKNGRAEPVDFTNQLGLYTLETRSGRVVYVGKCGVGDHRGHGIALRLYGHRFDDKKDQWTHFSWFGFRPVGPSGKLLKAPRVSMETAMVISDVEALLIGLMEPKLNQTSGKYRHIIKYQQAWL